MSLDASNWAWKQQLPPKKQTGVNPSSVKFVLVSMADRADEHHRCFPSISRLALDTMLDKKTIPRCIKVLI